MFPSTVTRYPYVSKDAHHKITYGTSSSISCKYAKLSKQISGQDNTEVLAVAVTQFPAGTAIGYNDKIVLPDGSFSKIVKINRINNHIGVEQCVEIYYGEDSI